MFNSHNDLSTTQKLNFAFNIGCFDSDFNNVLSESFRSIYDAIYNVEVNTTTSKNISKDFDELISESKSLLLESMRYAFGGFREPFDLDDYTYKTKLMMTAYGNVKIRKPIIRVEKLKEDFVERRVLKFIPRTRISEKFTPDEWFVIETYIKGYNIFIKNIIIEASKPVISQDHISDLIYQLLLGTARFIDEYQQISNR